MEALEILTVLLTLLEIRTSGDVFDYSSTQLLAEWMQSSLASLPALSAIGDLLTTVSRAVQLSTGQGQSQIWALFRDGSGHVFDSDTSATLLARLAYISDLKLRKSLVEAIAAADDTDEDGLKDLHAMLESLVAQAPPGTELNAEWSNQTVLGAIELGALAKPNSDNIDILISDPTISLQDAALLHSTGKAQSRPAVILAAISNMLARQWSTIDYNAETQTSQGPSDLFRPARLSSVLRFGGVQNVKLGDLPEEQRSFKFTVDMVIWNTKNVIESRSSLLTVLRKVLGMLCAAFDQPIAPTGSLPALVETLKSLPASPLKDALDQHVAPLLANEGALRDLSTMGQLWLGLSRALVDLYVTNIPIDPAVRRVLMGDVITARLSLLEDELSAVEEAEIEAKGVSDTPRHQHLLDRVAALVRDKEDLGPAIDRPTEVSRLAILYNEIHSYMGDAFSTSSVESLLECLKTRDSQALERERGFQLSAVAFTRRLSENYRDLQDLVTPILTAVLFARFGMRVLARHLDLQNKSPSESVLNAMRFPQSAVIAKFAQLAPSSPMSKAVLRDQFLAATALSVDATSPTQRVHHVPLLVDTLNQLYSSWSEIRQREQQDEQASESLYRVKKTDIEVKSDEELEEQEFAQMFPTYDEEDEEEPEEVAPKADDHSVRFDSEAVLTFHRLLMSAFGSDSAGIDFRSAIDKLLGTDFDASAHDESLDSQSLPLQIRHLHQRVKSLQPAKSHPNFYLEANEPQVRRAHTLILRVIARLDQLIADWPDQMVPQHIKDRCLEILRLHTRSPVAKVLNSLEQLLLHTNDWEGYANKENSLASYQAEISDLIVEWRRLELSSWMRLLDDQVGEYVNNDTEWTMRLFGALIQGVQTAEDVSAHLASTLPMISSYLSASTLGHFGSRVDTLKALGKMADEMARIGEYAQFKQTALLVHNIVENASLFLPRLNDSLNTQRAVIDKAIKDFVKLASWKDVNVYALKASAVKSHRQLHRNVRKFREVLRQRVAPILMDHNSICPQESASASPQGSIPPIFDSVVLSADALTARQAVQPAPPAHLVRLEDTLKRYRSIHEQVRSTLQPTGADSVDEMAVEIIETAAELAKATPETLTKENTKLVNNLASRKRKAYSDMLKALRASGFSNSVRADQLTKQQSSTWMSSLAGLQALPDGVDATDVRKVESYHHRLNVLMITLRAAFNGHNPDIASQDLERGIGYSESIFATALVQRQK
jgi:midasin